MPSSKKIGKPCIVCVVRKSRLVNGCCTRCNALVQSEGLHEKYGVPKESPRRQAQREKAEEYNRLIRGGMTQAQIAQMWKIPANQLATVVYKWKQSGFKMYNGTTAPKGSKPTATISIRPRKNEHGGGKTGIHKCKCDLCRKRRAENRRTQDSAYKKKVNQAKKAAREKAATQAP